MEYVIGAVIGLVLGAAAVLTAPRWRPLLGLGGVTDAPAADTAVAPISEVAPPAPVTDTLVANEASFSVELLLTASSQEAADYVARVLGQ